MLTFKLVIFVIVIVNFNSGNGQQISSARSRMKPSGFKLKQRFYEKLNQYRQRTTKTICYDIVGCFELPHRRSPLQKEPEDPAILDTKFYLFTRKNNFSTPEMISYTDDSLKRSSFDYKKPLKMVIHGYLGRWTDRGILLGGEAYLKIYDCNMVLMDWSIGSRGPQYTQAAANTEVVGRQLGLLLQKMVDGGLDPAQIHLLGFSLGAHVAGSASEVLKRRGHLIGRISGLDAASPLFRTNLLRERYKKLDREDARLVDVIHTDSSPSVTDGFGLWEPVGHVDYFPNGGQEQPGCIDTKQSIVMTHFDKSLSRDIACSHIRAWRLFEETLLEKAADSHNNCEFIAFTCPGGLKSFENGRCFPNIPKPNSSAALEPSYHREIGRFGEDVKGEGIMFFVTRGSPPYCGTQLQASVHISRKTGEVKGMLDLILEYNNHSMAFPMTCQIADYIMTGAVMSGLAAAEYRSLDNVTSINATLKFTDLEYEENSTYSSAIFVDKIVVRDMYGASWQFCKTDMLLEDVQGPNISFVKIVLTTDSC